MAYDRDIVFIKINFWHFNSNHSLSPDGMALMEQDVVFSITSEELENSIKKIYKYPIF